VALRPTYAPNLQSNVGNVDCRVKSPMETIRAYHQLLLLLAVLRLYHSVCTSPQEQSAMRGGPDINCVILDSAH
jgi:hypothetical protein